MLARTGVPLVLTGLVLGFVIGIIKSPVDSWGAARWISALRVSLLLGIQGLALSLVLTIAAAVYNFIVSFVGGIKLTADDPDEK